MKSSATPGLVTSFVVNINLFPFMGGSVYISVPTGGLLVASFILSRNLIEGANPPHV